MIKSTSDTFEMLPWNRKSFQFHLIRGVFAGSNLLNLSNNFFPAKLINPTLLSFYVWWRICLDTDYKRKHSWFQLKNERNYPQFLLIVESMRNLELELKFESSPPTQRPPIPTFLTPPIPIYLNHFTLLPRLYSSPPITPIVFY